MTSNNKAATASRSIEEEVAIVLGAATLVMSEAASQDSILVLANCYSTVHPSRRATVQAQVMQSLMSTENVDMAALSQVLTTFTNVSDLATKASRKAPVENVTLTQATMLASLYLASQVLADKVSAEAMILASAMVEQGVSDEAREGILAQAQAIVDSTEAKAKGERRSYKVTLATLLENGTLAIGQEIVGQDGTKATLVKEGVKVGSKTFGSLSKAAESVTGHETNGWAWFTVERDGAKVTVGSLRSN